MVNQEDPINIGKDSKIIIVGNGGSLKEKKLGSFIDSFDIVVRFNNFQLQGFADLVGTRTDVICRRCCDDVIMHDSSSVKSLVGFVTYGKWNTGMEIVGRQLKTYYKQKIHIVGTAECKDIGEKIGLEQPLREWASIGGLAIPWFCKHYNPQNITVCGFDFLKKNINGKSEHYFNKPPKDDCYHNGEKEELYLKSLPIREWI